MCSTELEYTCMYNQFARLSDNDLLDKLWEIMQIDYRLGYNIYIIRLCQGHNHDKALQILETYYDNVKNYIKNDINILNCFSSIFVLEPKHIKVYDNIVNEIERYYCEAFSTFNNIK